MKASLGSTRARRHAQEQLAHNLHFNARRWPAARQTAKWRKRAKRMHEPDGEELHFDIYDFEIGNEGAQTELDKSRAQLVAEQVADFKREKLAAEERADLQAEQAQQLVRTNDFAVIEYQTVVEQLRWLRSQLVDAQKIDRLREKQAAEQLAALQAEYSLELDLTRQRAHEEKQEAYAKYRDDIAQRDLQHITDQSQLKTESERACRLQTQLDQTEAKLRADYANASLSKRLYRFAVGALLVAMLAIVCFIQAMLNT